MTRLLLISLTLLVLSGCGDAYLNYSKPGLSQQQRAQDNFECKQADQTFEVWKVCLEARGYTVTEVREEARARPVTIQVPRTVNGLNLVQYADRALDLDRVPMEDINVAVVNPQFVLERSKAGMRALATLKEDALTRQSILNAMAKDLRTQEVNVKEKMGEFNDYLKARQAELVQEYTEKIQKITARVAFMSGIDLVLDNFGNSDQAKANVPLPVLELMRRATEDLTEDVIEKFDRTYK